MKTVLLILLSCAGADAQILNQVLYGITPIIKTPVDSNSGGSCTGSSGAWTCTGTTSVTITDATADFIRYTTNGSTPSFASGTLYTGAFNISATTTLKAIGCTLLDAKCGGVLTSVYTISASPAYGTLIYSAALLGSTSSDVLTTTGTAAAGSTIVLYYTNTTSPDPVTAVTDSGCGGTWHIIGTVDSGGNPITFAWTLCPSGLASGGTITASHMANFNFKTYVAMTANTASGGVDQSNLCGPTASFTTPFPVTCPITTVATNTVVFYEGGTGNTYTVVGTYTQVGTITDGNGVTFNYGYKVQSTAATTDPAGTCSASCTFRFAVGSFK